MMNLYLKKSSSVADIVPYKALRSDSDLILVNRALRLCFLHFSVSIHAVFLLKYRYTSFVCIDLAKP